MKAIYKRELKSYMQNMTGCIFIAFVTAFVGVYFMALNLNYGYPYFSYTLSSVMFILILAIPVLTMRSFAEEKKNKTDQLLLTSPVSLFSVVMGKYLSMVTVFAVPVLFFCSFPLIIKEQGTAYLKVDYCSLLMYFLLGCVFISIGMYLSALTESQIIAVISSVGVFFLIYLWDSLKSFMPTNGIFNAIAIVVFWTAIALIVYQNTKNKIIAGILEAAGVAAVAVAYIWKSELFEELLSNLMGKFSLVSTFTEISDNSIFDISGVILYLSLIGLFVFLTMQSIQKRRWS